MAFGDVNFGESVNQGPGPPPWRFWLLGPNIKTTNDGWNDPGWHEPDDHGGAGGLPLPGDFEDERADLAWDWCCLPLIVWFGLPGVLFGGATKKDIKRWKKRKICVPCVGVNPAFKSREECIRRCLSRTRVPPAVGGGGSAETPDDDPETPDGGWTPLYCIAEKYQYIGDMHIEFLHRLPAANVLEDIIQNGDLPNNQNYFSQLINTSRGVNIHGKYTEKTSKVPQLQTYKEGAGAPPDMGTLQGRVDCQEAQAPCRFFDIQCEPMILDMQESNNAGFNQYRTKITFKFINEYCRTEYRNILGNDWRIQGPHGRGSIQEECGGTEWNCRSEQNYSVNIAGNPDNWDMDPNVQIGEGQQGGPMGGTVQMFLTRPEQELIGCTPCCNPLYFAEMQVMGLTTGAFKVAQFLAWILKEVNGQANPGTGTPGYIWDGPQACCRTIVKEAWANFMVPYITGNNQYNINSMALCNPTPPDRPEWNLKPAMHLPSPTGAQFINPVDQWGGGGNVVTHQGICMHRATEEQCKTSALGEGPPGTGGF